MPFSIHRQLAATVLMALLVSAASSCQKKQVAVPVASEPTPAPAAEAPHQQPAAPPQPVTTPAPATPATAAPPAPRDETQYQQNKPPDQPPPPKHASHPAGAPPAPAAQPPPPSTAPPDPPRLGDILTPDQQRQYNTAIDVSLAHAQASLGFISTRQLTREQQSTVAEIQNFIRQAQEKRKDELAAAKSLAERAEVLSHDLVASLR